jgi:hypothetical protein
MAEVYKGIQIAISTTQSTHKRWTARAEYAFPGKESVRLEALEATYDTEEEAHRAALRAAIESIDKMRAATGKR